MMRWRRTMRDVATTASSDADLGDVADVDLGVGQTAVASAALHRVCSVAVISGRRQLTALSRRLIPTTPLPPSTRGMALHGGTLSSWGVRVDAAPEVVASVRSPPGMFSLSWAANWSSPCRTAYASDTSSIAEQPEVSNAW